MNLGLPLLIKRKHMFHKHKRNCLFSMSKSDGVRLLIVEFADIYTKLYFDFDFKVAQKLYGTKKMNQDEKEKVTYSFHI